VLKQEMFRQDLRHINTNSDSEVLLNVLAHELELAAKGSEARPRDHLYGGGERAPALPRRLRRGGLDCGLRAARVPRPIRNPSARVRRNHTDEGPEYLVASESVALTAFGFELVRDILPGEAIFIDENGTFNSRQCAANAVLAPCIFEYVYLARPDSVMDAVSVYESRLHMGVKLSEKIKRTMPHLEIDVVIPVPDTSRPAALELAHGLNVTYREGLSAIATSAVLSSCPVSHSQEVGTPEAERRRPRIQGQNVLIVDDSIVRGTTAAKSCRWRAKRAPARCFCVCSAAVRFPNVYGIDMPTRAELIATGRNEEQVAREIGADAVIYQDLDALKDAVRAVNPKLTQFETSCFDGYTSPETSPASTLPRSNGSATPAARKAWRTPRTTSLTSTRPERTCSSSSTAGRFDIAARE